MAFECIKEARKTFVTGKVVLESSQKIQLSYAVSFYKMICLLHNVKIVIK